MNDNNNEEYFRTLITQPPLNHYNEYDDEKCVPVTVLDRVFCDNDEVDCSTESEDPYKYYQYLTVKLRKREPLLSDHLSRSPFNARK